jgi:FAD synthase
VGERTLVVPLVRTFVAFDGLIVTTQFQANLPDESITPLSTSVKTGVYYGYAQVIPPKDRKSEWPSEDTKVLPMAMSLGWNPFYKNERLTAVGVNPLQSHIRLMQ